MISSTLVLAALILGLISYFQATHFNSTVTINGIKVGHLKPEQALKRLSAYTLKNDVYIGKKLIVDGKDTGTKFTEHDLASIQEILKQQWTWFPSFKRRNYNVNPAQNDRYRSVTLRNEVEKKLKTLNKHLKAPKNAYAYLEDGKIKVAKSVNGEQYNVNSLMKAYDQQEYNSEIHLNAHFLLPIKENSKTVKNEKEALRTLIQRKVDYKVQDQTYTFNAKDLIKNAQVTEKRKLKIDPSVLKNKVAEINKKQSTLNKKFTFKTHSGSMISVQGQSYGWALNVSQETKRIEKAFEKGKKSLKAYNVYGVGYSTYGIGYHNPTNHGIGNTYAEVSIKEQKIWIYKNGKLVTSTNVVTGRHNTHEDTPKGLWYVMYKESPSVLEGSEVGNPNYSVKVNYWAPFTMSGCGFHDASWRRNWKSDAYLTQGSGGCVNTPPKVMKTVYDNLEQNEPVVIY
ncbi:L,D-transpeptidase family protein [Sporolactobacillus kofuensis]|uniref:L,D-transpeptidase family protein n=1 Tax=Sporolactobacillus kofuensis TaxID=269672 RepID=A0ABW1WK44_9BACL|nr:L,D-transpeptidase/peptidoglycan binding protein [Sporolactobacillus kofuensis]